MAPLFGFTSKTIKIDHSTILFVLALVAGVLLFLKLQQILMLFFLAFIVMVALNPVVKRFQSWGVRRSLAIFTTYLLLIIAISLFIAIVIPPLVYQLINLITFIRTSPWFTAQFEFMNGDIEALQSQLAGLQLSLSDVSSFFGSLQTPVSVILSMVGAVFSNLFLVFSIFVMAYFMLVERPQLHLKLRWFTKDGEKIERAREYLEALEHQLGGWVRGQLVLMLVIGLLTFLGLTALGVPYAVPLAITAGLLELIPNLGPTIAAVPALIIALAANGPVSAGATLLFAIFVQQLENNLLVPRIMRQSAEVSPLVVLMAILIGTQLAGILGALLAVPLYITLRSWYSFYVHPRIS